MNRITEPEKIPTNDVISTTYNKTVKDVLTKNIKIPKPVLKWVGGKTQILNIIILKFPIEMNNYREMFSR